MSRRESRKLAAMPELPEVETTRRGLAPHLEGRVVADVVLRRPDLRWPIPRGDRGVAARSADRFRSSAREIPAARHRSRQRAAAPRDVRQPARPARPTRRWRRTTTSTSQLADRGRTKGRVLRFNDPRRFGCLLWQPPGEVHELLRGLGPEPLSDAFDGDYLFARSRGRKAPIKTFLMDQGIVVGVGNIYAAEALFEAGISPLREAGKVSRERYHALSDAVKRILAYAIERGGTTLRDFISPDGLPGYFELELAAYGRGGEPCPRCGKAMKEGSIGQRTTVWCPRCQR